MSPLPATVALSLALASGVAAHEAIGAAALESQAPPSVKVVDGNVIITFASPRTRVQTFALQAPEGANFRLSRIDKDRSLDLEVWHLDEGMGTYTLHYLFLYSAQARQFVPLAPKCGSAFINLHIARPGTLRYSTYDVSKHSWRRCTDGV